MHDFFGKGTLMDFTNIKQILNLYKNNNIVKGRERIKKSLLSSPDEVITDFNIVVLTSAKTKPAPFVKSFITDFVIQLGLHPDLVEKFNSLEESYMVKETLSKL